MNRIKLIILTTSLFFISSSYSQISFGLNFNYMTSNNESINWGFTVHPEYKLSHQWRVGISTSIFLDPNPFPDYIEFADSYNNPPNIVAGTAYTLFPIDATLKHYFNKKEKEKLQPYFQINAGVAVVGTFTKVEIITPNYFQYTHQTNNYFSLGYKIGTDYSITKKIDLNVNAGYSRVFSDNANKFTAAPLNLNDYNSFFNHYFIFSAGLKYNFD